LLLPTLHDFLPQLALVLKRQPSPEMEAPQWWMDRRRPPGTAPPDMILSNMDT